VTHGDNFGMPGNPHVDALLGRELPVVEAQYLATLAQAFELRTLTLALSQNTPGWLDEVRARLGYPTAPPAPQPPAPEERDQRCNKPLMDGRNEIRCWGPKDHDGDCT
jgi:hypothetical protein